MKVPASTSRKAPLAPAFFFPSQFLFENSNGWHRAWCSVLHPRMECLALNAPSTDFFEKIEMEGVSRSCAPAGSLSIFDTEFPAVKSILGRIVHTNPVYAPTGLLAVPKVSPVPGSHPSGRLETPRAGKAGSRALPEPARHRGRLADRRLLPVASPRGPAPGAWPKGRLSGRPSPCLSAPDLARWDRLRTLGAALGRPQP